MRFGIFSDVHSNLQALEAVLASLADEKPRQLFCAGDVVGYGANPAECIRLIRNNNVVCVAGNHDWAVAGKIEFNHFSKMAQEAVIWTREHLDKEDLRFLKQMDLIYKHPDFLLTHGTLFEPERFHYLIDRSTAGLTFAQMDSPLCFVGHSHIPTTLIKEKKEISCVESDRIDVVPGCQYIVNVGSVGQPRDGNPSASYALFDTEQNTIVIKRVPYDIQEAQHKILLAGLPRGLADRLGTGR